MRAVNNTLREIILRERPLTVTNNDSLVLSPPLPLLPLFASLSIHPFAPPSTCLSTLFLFTPRDLLYMPLYYMGARLYETLPTNYILCDSSSLRIVEKYLYSNPIVYVYVNTNSKRLFFIFASSLVRRPLRHDEFFPIDPRLENVFFLGRPLSRVQAH